MSDDDFAMDADMRRLIGIVCERFDTMMEVLDEIKKWQDTMGPMITSNAIANAKRVWRFDKDVGETWECGNCNAVMSAAKRFHHVCC